jgi:hypothetical protein
MSTKKGGDKSFDAAKAAAKTVGYATILNKQITSGLRTVLTPPPTKGKPVLNSKAEKEKRLKKLRFLRYLRYKKSIPTSLLGLEVDDNNLTLTKNEALLFSFEKIQPSAQNKAAAQAAAQTAQPAQAAANAKVGGSRLYKYKNYWYKKTYKRNGKEYIFCKNEKKYILITKLKQKGGGPLEDAKAELEKLETEAKAINLHTLNIKNDELQQLETEAIAQGPELPDDILEKIYGILEAKAIKQALQPFDSINADLIKAFYKYYICVFNSLFSKQPNTLDFLQKLTNVKENKNTDTTIIFDIKLSVDDYKRTQYKFNIIDGALIEPQLEQQSAFKSILDANPPKSNLINFINYIKLKPRLCQLFNVYIKNANGIQSFDFMQKFTNLKFYGLLSRTCYIKCYECINNLINFGENYLKKKNIYPIWHPLLNEIFGSLYVTANQIEKYYSKSTGNNIAKEETIVSFEKYNDSYIKNKENRYSFVFDNLQNENNYLYLLQQEPTEPPLTIEEYIIENIITIEYSEIKNIMIIPPNINVNTSITKIDEGQLYYLCDLLNQSNETINKYINDQYSIKSYKSIEQINDKVKLYSSNNYTIFNKKATTKYPDIGQDPSWYDSYDINPESLYNKYIDAIDTTRDGFIQLPALCPDR